MKWSFPTSAFSVTSGFFMFVLENLQNITRHGISRIGITSLVVYNKMTDGYTVVDAPSKEVKLRARKNLEKD
ncbi:MAG: hypothetical protein H6545_01655 [Bacteroidales bacterium]|nr:hypothetical protein [Bacteroidales bacterium]